MTRDEICLKAKLVISGCCTADEDQIELFHRLHADLDFDSIDILDLVFCLEREFGIKISREDFFPSGKTPTVQFIVDYLDRRLNFVSPPSIVKPPPGGWGEGDGDDMY